MTTDIQIATEAKRTYKTHETDTLYVVATSSDDDDECKIIVEVPPHKVGEQVRIGGPIDAYRSGQLLRRAALDGGYKVQRGET
jgi:hypothetical protein